MALRPVSLLERLAGGGATVPDPRQRLRQSILRNLRDVLNARAGHAKAQMDLGLPPPSDLVQEYPACIPRLQRAIADGIARYEPRLEGVRVVHVPQEGSLSLHFRVAAQLADGSRTPVSFSTLVAHGGRVSLGA